MKIEQIHNIPKEILDAARLIDLYFQKNGIAKWELMNICSRNHVDKINKATKLIEENASQKARSDNEDFNAYDYSGGNYDDAYYQGCDDGEIIFARTLKEILDEKG